MDMPISKPIKSRDMYCTGDRESHVSSCSATESRSRALAFMFSTGLHHFLVRRMVREIAKYQDHQRQSKFRRA
jgi:hypothetical protein